MNKVRVGPARTAQVNGKLTLRAIRDCLMVSSLLDFGIPYVPSLVETPVPLLALLLIGCMSVLGVFPEAIYAAVETSVIKRREIIVSPLTIPIALGLFGLTSVGELFLLFRGVPPALLAILIGMAGYGLKTFFGSIRDALVLAQQRVRANKLVTRDVAEITRSILIVALCSGRLLGLGASVFLWQEYQSMAALTGGVVMSLIILLFVPVIEPLDLVTRGRRGQKRAKISAELSAEKRAILGLPVPAVPYERYRRPQKRKSLGSVCTSGSDRLSSRAAISMLVKQGEGQQKTSRTPVASPSGRLETLRRLAAKISSRISQSSDKAHGR